MKSLKLIIAVLCLLQTVFAVAQNKETQGKQLSKEEALQIISKLARPDMSLIDNLKFYSNGAVRFSLSGGGACSSYLINLNQATKVTMNKDEDDHEYFTLYGDKILSSGSCHTNKIDETENEVDFTYFSFAISKEDCKKLHNAFNVLIKYNKESLSK